ncbi:MAG: hypothetical protein MJ007_03175 [Paludibacteraceae bacterium]|nr:hypothetical protein [Paludibacteraceae bacterium]
MKQRKRLIPNWYFDLPKSTFTDMHFDRSRAFGITREEALQKAYTQAFDKESSRLGKKLDMKDVTKAVKEGTSVQAVSLQYALPIKFFDPPYFKGEVTSGWECTVLYQVARDCNVDIAHFDNYNTNQFDIWKAIQDSIDKVKKDELKESNVRAIAASTFIPGVGQMLKGQYGAGCGFLLGELALFGGGTACYFIADKQNNTIQQIGVSYEDFKNARDTKKICNVAMWCCFGAGAALHIANMCHAYLCEDKKLAKVIQAFEPVIIPTNEYSKPSYAVGLSFHYNF